MKLNLKYRLLVVTVFFAFNQVVGQGDLNIIMQTGHYAPVTTVEYSPNGELIVTGSEDKTIKLWEVKTGREIRTFKGHTKSLTNVHFSPDGMKIVSVSYDRKAIVWDVLTGEQLQTFIDSTDQIRNAIFTPDGEKVLTGGHEVNAILWDVNTGKRLQQFQKNPSTCYQCEPTLAFSRDGNTLVTGSGDRTVMLWDVEKGDTIKSFHYSKGWCSSCASFGDLSKDKKELLIGEYGEQLMTVNIETGNVEQLLLEEGDYQQVGYSPDNKYAAAIEGYRGKLMVWNLKTAELVLSITSEEGLNGFSFSPKNNHIAVANGNHTANVYHIASKENILDLKGIVNRPKTPRLNDSQVYYLDKLSEVKLSNSAKQLAFYKRSEDVVLWDLDQGKATKQLNGHEELVTCLAYSHDDKYIATGSLDRQIIIWNSKTGDMVRKIDAHRGMIFSVSFSENDEQLVSTSWDGAAIVWDVKSGERISWMDVHDESPYCASITQQGLYVITGGLDKELVMTEPETRKMVKSFTGPTENTGAIFYLPESNSFISAGWDKKIRVWDIYSSLQTMKLEGHEGAVFSVDVDKNRKYILSGSDDKTAKLWDFNSGKLIRTFEGHNGAITYVKLFPDGKRILTSSRDGSVKIWELETGKEIITHFSLDKNEWAVKTEKGYFDATTQSRQSLYFVKGIKTYSLSQFFDQFYQPGILKEVLGDKQGYEQRKGNLFKELNQSPPPQVTILAPFDKDVKKERGVELIIKVLNNGGGIDEIKVLHNGKRINYNDNLSKVPGKGLDMTKSYRLLLLPGNNTIEVTAFSDARIESQKEVVNIYYEGAKKVANCYVVAIGINEYKNTQLNLSYARADAKGFVKTFNENGGSLFKDIFLFPIYNQSANKSNIMATIDSVASFVQPEDVFIFYYAGHGGMSENEFFFIPYDNVSLYQKSKLDKSAISAKALKEKLRSIKALKQIILLDACHAGASTEMLAKRGGGEEKALAQMSRSEGIHILGAAGSEQQATEFGTLGHGVFTYVLLEAISGKADGAPKDGKVTIYELISYLDDQVPELSQKYQGQAQYPYTFSLGHDFPITFIAR